MKANCCFCCSYSNGSVFSSLPLPAFAHILAEMVHVKTFEFYAANCSKPNGSKKRDKNTDFNPMLFFEKGNGSNLAMLVRAVTQQTRRPQERKKTTDFDLCLLFENKKRAGHFRVHTSSNSQADRKSGNAHLARQRCKRIQISNEPSQAVIHAGWRPSHAKDSLEIQSKHDQLMTISPITQIAGASMRLLTAKYHFS